MNHVILVGRLTRDCELKYIAGSGTPVAQFGLAVDREFSKDGKKETDFIDIQVWGKSAENCANYIVKGSLVAIQGSIRIDTYQNQAGENRKVTRVNATRVKFLDSKKDASQGQDTDNEPRFEPSFTPAGLDADGWNAISDSEIPF